MKIKNSILTLLLFFTLVPVLVFGLFSIYETNQSIDEMAEKNLKAVSENQIMNIQKFCGDRREEMEMVANYTLTQDAIRYSLGESDNPVDQEYVNNVLKERKKYGTFVASVSILDKNFHVVGSSESYEISEVSELKYVDERFHTGDFIIGNSYERETDDGLKKIVPAYIGVFFNDNLIGYIAEELDTAYFDQLRLNMDSLADGTFYILDGNNAIITAGKTTQKESLSQLESSDKDREDFQKAWDAINHEENPQGEIRYRYQGMSYITYYSNVECTDWGVRITENLSAQKKSANNYSFLMAFAVAFVTVGILIAQYMITKKLLAPIEKIMDTFTRIKTEQDYSLRIPIETKDEMGKLSAGINELLAYIEDEDMQEKQRQRHLRELAECDPLTGIKNKKAIEQTMLSMVQQAAENDGQVVIGFLDIDDFRDYNTNFGHQEGDGVIQFVADILQRELKGCVGRNGGDEFVFGYAGDLDKSAIEAVVSRILKQLNENYISQRTKQPMPVPCSIGIVSARGNTFDYANLIQKADEAMYRAKEAGKNTFYIMEL